MPSANPIPAALLQEGERVMRICNACRYCEGFCAVFPALERRLTFREPDLNYLANLCHNCSACYFACPYAPPHEFALNLPRTLAEIRAATYRKYAWPGFFAVLFRRNGWAAGIILLAAGPGLFLFSAHPVAVGSFYAVIPHKVMMLAFGAVSLWILAALAIGFARFWRDMGQTGRARLSLGALMHAMGDTLRLRYLKGGGEGCTYPEEWPSHGRRWFHHLTFYGFLLCFASTTVAAIYHYVFRWEAPYPLWSAPVVLGSLGGLGLLAGPLGLLWLRRARNPELTDRNETGMDLAFIALLFLTSLTGFLLLALREKSVMGVLLAVHLGAVMALFITLPYGKFVHALYRFAALLRNAQEEASGSRPQA